MITTTQGSREYVVMQTHAIFGSFQIYELTDPADPQFVSAWDDEYLCEGDFCSDDPHAETDLYVIFDVYFGWMLDGFGRFRNRFLHDVTVTEDGTRAYLSNWDAGLILLDISDPANPQFISQALEAAAGDGEVNSHAAWPSEDGNVASRPTRTSIRSCSRSASPTDPTPASTTPSKDRSPPRSSTCPIAPWPGQRPTWDWRATPR